LFRFPNDERRIYFRWFIPVEGDVSIMTSLDDNQLYLVKKEDLSLNGFLHCIV